MKISTKINKFAKLSLSEVIFISLMSSANFVIDILVSPFLKLVFTHVIAGVLIMVPINFIFITITKYSIEKFGSLTLYLIIFSIISIPTNLFGGVAGIYKVIVGLVLGFLLDIVFLPKNTKIRFLTSSIFGSIFWWISVFTIWEIFNLPFVFAFSNALKTNSFINSIIPVSEFINLPIVGFGWEFLKFSIFCGLISAFTVIIGFLIGYRLFMKMNKTSIFKMLNQYLNQKTSVSS